jgi:hypothetical protein
MSKFYPLPPHHLVDSAEMTGSLTGTVTPVGTLDNICYQFIWSGNPTGSFKIQGSLDYTEDSTRLVTNAGTWVDYPLPVVATASVGSDSVMVGLNQVEAHWLRPIYARTGGSGSLDIWVAGKGV